MFAHSSTIDRKLAEHRLTAAAKNSSDNNLWNMECST